MANWVPVIAQAKSGVQLLCGDKEGAVQTQKDFIRRCPGISQLAMGHPEAAKETQKECLHTVSHVANALPVIGHVKGLVHYAAGDKKGGKHALTAATRTTVVVGSGMGGFAVAGPAGAIAAGIGAGIGVDAVLSACEHKPQGYVAAAKNVTKKNVKPGEIFDAIQLPIADGFAGFSGGLGIETEAATAQAAQSGIADAAAQAAAHGHDSSSLMNIETGGEDGGHGNLAKNVVKSALHVDPQVAHAAVTPSMLAQTAGPVTAIAASMATSDMKKNDTDEGNYEKFDYDKYDYDYEPSSVDYMEREFAAAQRVLANHAARERNKKKASNVKQTKKHVVAS